MHNMRYMCFFVYFFLQRDPKDNASHFMASIMVSNKCIGYDKRRPQMWCEQPLSNIQYFLYLYNTFYIQLRYKFLVFFLIQKLYWKREYRSIQGEGTIGSGQEVVHNNEICIHWQEWEMRNNPITEHITVNAIGTYISKSCIQVNRKWDKLQ